MHDNRRPADSACELGKGFLGSGERRGRGEESVDAVGA